MRFVWAAFLIIAAAPACAEWEHMVSSAGITIYIDPQTIRDEAGMRRVVALVSYSDVLPNGARSQRGIMEYDCKERRFRTATFSQYTEPLAQGVMLSDNSEPSEWSGVRPDTFAAHSLDYVCTK